MNSLYAEGTGYKRRPDPERDINNRGELRIVLGVDKRGQIIPWGAFRDARWDDIMYDLYWQQKSERPLSEILVSDGERGIAKSFSYQVCNVFNAQRSLAGGEPSNNSSVTPSFAIVRRMN